MKIAIVKKPVSYLSVGYSNITSLKITEMVRLSFCKYCGHNNNQEKGNTLTHLINLIIDLEMPIKKIPRK